MCSSFEAVYAPKYCPVNICVCNPLKPSVPTGSCWDLPRALSKSCRAGSSMVFILFVCSFFVFNFCPLFQLPRVPFLTILSFCWLQTCQDQDSQDLSLWDFLSPPVVEEVRPWVWEYSFPCMFLCRISFLYLPTLPSFLWGSRGLLAKLIKRCWKCQFSNVLEYCGSQEGRSSYLLERCNGEHTKRKRT